MWQIETSADLASWSALSGAVILPADVQPDPLERTHLVLQLPHSADQQFIRLVFGD
ncbi:MAG: hypothetical protein LR015_09600 [Verrucomicrobia bacterium]|nr:hypothetical protein [Verrucomicrobiota bacterium]